MLIKQQLLYDELKNKTIQYIYKLNNWKLKIYIITKQIIIDEIKNKQ